ncbi:MAG: ABC transporter permease [Spirochaetales bacterium]|nr:ABC transporter permease [Spirochaetales bacterium]
MFRFRTAFRYAFSKTRGHRVTSIMILVGIAIGLIALLVISAVMNGLQNAQMDQLRNLESFDLIVRSDSLKVEDIRSLNGVDQAFRFIETNALIVDETSENSQSIRIRAFDGDIFEAQRFAKSLTVISGSKDNMAGLLFSYTTRSRIGISYSDSIKMTFLRRGKTATIVPYSSHLPVSGFFSSKMSEFSSSTAFMDYSILSGIIGTEDSKIAVYVSGNQKTVVQSIRNLDPDADIITWQEYNKALYSALMLEKTLMYVFLAFMFLIICVNLKNSTRRLLSNKQKEGAMLRALGCSRRSVNAIFLGQGLVISVLGEILGVILGKILIANLQNVLKLVDNVVYAVSGSRTVLTQIPFNASIGGLETAIVCLFIFLLSLLFTLIGCRRIYRSEIMEVILNASY